MDRSTENLLLGLVVPGHCIFNLLLSFVNEGKTETGRYFNDLLSGFLSGSEGDLTMVFMVLYMIAALIQVGFLLKLSTWLVDFLWSKGIDPDSAAIPYLTSLGDLLGGALLSSAVYLEHSII